jgi:hypothetical protein
MQLVASFAHATSNMVRQPTSTPVLLMANGMGRMELQAHQRSNISVSVRCMLRTRPATVAHQAPRFVSTWPALPAQKEEGAGQLRHGSKVCCFHVLHCLAGGQTRATKQYGGAAHSPAQHTQRKGNASTEVCSAFCVMGSIC